MEKSLGSGLKPFSAALGLCLLACALNWARRCGACVAPCCRAILLGLDL